MTAPKTLPLPFSAVPVGERTLLIFAAALVMGMAAASENRFLQDTLILMLLWAGLAGAWNLAGGFAGQLSLGHAAFFGLGAYASTILKLELGVSPWLGMMAGGLLATALGTLVAFAATRLRGPYFGLATIALAAVMQIIAARWYDLTRGNEGLTIPFDPGFANFMFEGKAAWTLIALCYVAVVYMLARWLQGSRLGFQMLGMREDEVAAESVGVHTRRLKIWVIGISAFLTALGGTFYAQYVGFVDPTYVFSLDLSIKFALMCAIGGMGTPIGPVLGAVLITGLEMYLRATFGGGESGLHLIIYGMLLIIVVRTMPDGLVTGLRRLPLRWRREGAS